MNLKKSFVGCLSMFLVFSPASFHAMVNLGDHLNSEVSYGDKAVDFVKKLKVSNESCNRCGLCWGLITNPKNETRLPCGHSIHERCLFSRVKNNNCIACYNSFIESKNYSDLADQFRKQGIIDIHDVPDMKNKTDDQIIDFFMDLAKSGKGCFSTCCIAPPEDCKINIKFYTRLILLDSKPYEIDDEKVGILDGNFCVKFNAIFSRLDRDLIDKLVKFDNALNSKNFDDAKKIIASIEKKVNKSNNSEFKDYLNSIVQKMQGKLRGEKIV